ncbi:MAG: SCO family protein [Chitinophagaceae bacterium]
MNKKALYALMLAVLLPLFCYLVVKWFSGSAVDMPKHYLPDTVISVVKDGKRVSDTVWHQLPDFSLVNQQGKRVSWDSIGDKIVIADFFFTRCPTICPRLTLNMRWLQQSINNSRRVGDKTPDFIHFLSFSIDPERDSVPQLKHWADRFQVNPEQWWLLTGEKKAIYDMAIREMKLGVVDGHGVDTSFLHTDLFVLIDGHRRIRGYYHGLDTMALRHLSSDIIFLSMEKDPAKKTFLDGKLEIMAVAFICAIIGVGILLLILRKKKHVSTGLEEK